MRQYSDELWPKCKILSPNKSVNKLIRMHSSRMRTACSLTVPWGVFVRGVSAQDSVCPGGVCPGGVCPGGVCQGCLSRMVSARGGVPCDLAHNTFDVSCMLSLLQLRLNSNAAAHIVLGHVTCDACCDTPLLL